VANGDKDVFLLETRRGFEVEATANHKFFTPLGWKEMKELVSGDWVAIARSFPVFGNRKMLDGHGKLLGLLLGDGHISGGSGPGITNADPTVLNEFKRLVLSLGKHHFNYYHKGKATTIIASKSKKVLNRHLGVSALQQFCVHYGIWGKIAKTKTIPSDVFTASKEDIADVLAGLFMTDGWIFKGHSGWEIGYSTTSKEMAKQIHHLLLRFGVVSFLRFKRGTLTYKGVRKPISSYAITVTGQNFVLQFIRQIGPFITGKRSYSLEEVKSHYEKADYICRYDLMPKTEEMLSVLRKAIHSSGKTKRDIAV